MCTANGTRGKERDNGYESDLYYKALPNTTYFNKGCAPKKKKENAA